jgi:hypothetical protein
VREIKACEPVNTVPSDANAIGSTTPTVGAEEGDVVGTEEGAAVGDDEGAAVGIEEGAAVGAGVCMHSTSLPPVGNIRPAKQVAVPQE